MYVVAMKEVALELELELIQTQMTQKPMRAEVYARALRASQSRKEDCV